MSPFLYDGKYPLWDHVTFRAVAEQESPYLARRECLRPDGHAILRQDICYPALVMAAVGCFPDTQLGGWLFVSIGAILYVMASIVFFWRYATGSPVISLVMLCTSLPFILAVHVGNMIVYAAAFVLLFFAWYDEESSVKRIVAAICLALAGVLKISPVILGVMYLGKRWRENVPLMVLSTVSFVALLVIPFAFYDGLSGMLAWVENARMNAGAYVGRNGFGISGIVQSVLAVFGYLHEVPPIVLTVARVMTVCLSAWCLIVTVVCAGVRTLDRVFLACVGMLFLPPTMMIYCSLYALPVLLAMMIRTDRRIAKGASIAFFATAMPLQIPLLLGSANACFSSVALVDLSWLCLASKKREGDGLNQTFD